MKQNITYLAGLDIGSTTAKLVLVDETRKLIFSRYQRHYARIMDTVSLFFSDVAAQLGNCRLQLSVTGSAGMGFSQIMALPFVQEVICTSEAVRQIYPLTATVKNCLFKVLKLIDMGEMGNHIVLQGGAGKNPAIVRALEILTGTCITHTDMPEMMGALGAALAVKKSVANKGLRAKGFAALDRLDTIADFKTRQIVCKGCENACAVTRFVFSSGGSFYSGNRCEKIFGAKGEGRPKKGFDFADFKYRLLFDRNLAPHRKPKFTVGIPRCLNFYENFAFWHAFFVHCGINVTLSAGSTMAMSDAAKGSIMSDNICFPAKLANAHVLDLVRRGVDRIFYPLVMYEYEEFSQVHNTFNCPIVSSYTDVIDSSLDLGRRKGIPLDKPVITFRDAALLTRACVAYLKPLGIAGSRIRAAVKKGLAAHKAYKKAVREKGARLVERSGRPYHIDPLINQKIPRILTDFGVDFITEDAVPDTSDKGFDSLQVLTQWAYPNRLYRAASWVARQPDHIQMIQLNSFGCGPERSLPRFLPKIIPGTFRRYFKPPGTGLRFCHRRTGSRWRQACGMQAMISAILRFW